MKENLGSEESNIYSEDEDIELILVNTLNRALRCLVKGVESGDVETGMIAKNLEVDQAVIIAVNLGYFTIEDLDGYLDKFKKNDDEDVSNRERLINDTRLSNLKIGFMINRIKSRKPAMIEGVI